MVRPLRIVYPGALYHVTSRGNAQQCIYEDDGGRHTFVAVLEAVVHRYHWLCHAYCLMDHHDHLVIETPDGNLPRGMPDEGWLGQASGNCCLHSNRL
jgi:putative transposase